jgi:putative hydrolase of the HAD superfamily
MSNCYPLWLEHLVSRSRQLELGTPGSTEAALERLVHAARTHSSLSRVLSAAALWEEFQRSVVTPRSAAQGVIEQLRSHGYRIGLVANQPIGLPSLWKEVPIAAHFDAALFSCEVGILKPDPRIYAMACQRLNVTPERCLFVGDGGSAELTGATRVGMQAIRIRVPYEDIRLDALLGRETWTGVTIASLDEVVSIAAHHLTPDRSV